jgi:poly(A) polymerase
LKIFQGGVALQSFRALRQYNLFAWLFPETDRMLHQQDGGFPDRLISLVLQSTDHRVAEELPITPAFLFAGLLWSVVEERKQELIANGVPAVEAASLAADTTISKQIARVAIPRRFTQMTREIWGLQHRFGKRTRKRCRKLAEHQRFRAAYDFLLLRAEAGEPVSELAQWWTRYQEVDDHQRVKMVDAVRKEESGHSGGRHQASRRV